MLKGWKKGSALSRVTEGPGPHEGLGQGREWEQGGRQAGCSSIQLLLAEPFFADSDSAQMKSQGGEQRGRKGWQGW